MVFEPRMIRAMPRYSASVPMVTASDGSPSRVTRNPLSRPAARPSSTRTAKIASIGQCLAHRKPSSALDMPRVDATDRSISPLMMMSVMGSAMIAISPDVTPMLKTFPLVQNCGEVTAPKMPMATTSTASPVSQRASGRSTADSGGTRRAALWLGSDTRTPSSQGGRQPDRDGPVEDDRHQQQEAGDRLVPERRDAEYVQRGVDRVEQQCADRRAHHTAAPPEDRHAA